MRTMLSLFAVSLVASVVACNGEGEGEGGGDDGAATGASAATLGWVTSEIKDRLMVSNPSDQGKSWSITNGNALTGDWLLQMPRTGTWGVSSLGPAKACTDAAHCVADFGLATCTSNAECGGGPCAPLAAADGKSVCMGHSDSILDDVYGVMTSAHSSVDVTSLTEPKGKYMAAMRSALTALDHKGEHVTVRFLFGSFPNNTPDLTKIIADLTRDVHPGTKLDITVGAHKRSPETWNHSKIIAADGREAIVGGMNLWDTHYLEADPVHDVSLHVHGPVASAAQSYVNELWSVPCGDGQIVGNRGNGCPRAFAASAAVAGPAPGNVRMIAVGRVGAQFHDPSDTALVAMMDMAQSKIRISQQDIGSVKVFIGGIMPDAYIDAWTRAARRNVDVTIIVSNDGAYGGGGNTTADAYFNSWSLQDLWRGLTERADKMWPDSHKQLCQHVHFAHMRSTAGASWASGMPQANHAKVVIVDDQAHYVGSQNLYDANLAEFGVIVDDQPATQQFVASYWTNLAKYSTPTTYVDPECR